MLDTDGFVAECSGENLFIVRGGHVKTTPQTSILAGITRDAVLALLRAGGISVSEERFTRDEAYLADEVFMTGTAAEVTPVREIDDRQIGPGRPGARHAGVCNAVSRQSPAARTRRTIAG